MEKNIKLEHPVTLGWLLRFALPTVFSTVFMSLYSSVDGMFVARLVDTNALSAINIVLPLIYLGSALGMMFGTGGNALVAKKIGEDKAQEAREDFSFLSLAAFVICAVLTVVFFIFLDPLCRFLGADDALLPACRTYMLPVLVTVPFSVFGVIFQMSFITVGKARLSAGLSVFGGVVNIALDWLFIAKLGMGLQGASIATGIGYALPSLIGLVLFAVDRRQVLYLVRPRFRWRTLWQSCGNGASEMVSVLAFSVITILFNRILMGFAGANGVASLSIIWYAQGLFGSLFRGYTNGIASVVSYNLGRQDRQRLHRLFWISCQVLFAVGAAATALSFGLGRQLVGFFAKNNGDVADMALHGFRIVATSFLMMAFNVFASGWFTALNDGRTSAILSFCRTILFMVVPVLVLPRIWGIDGVWLSITAGEVLSLFMSLFYFVKYRCVWAKD